MSNKQLPIPLKPGYRLLEEGEKPVRGDYELARSGTCMDGPYVWARLIGVGEKWMADGTYIRRIEPDEGVLKKLSAQEFVEVASPDECRIVLVDYVWQLRCETGVLCKPDGEVGFQNLPGLMSIMAGLGIHRCVVEWHGLLPWSFD